jgi:hypothetical protein
MAARHCKPGLNAEKSGADFYQQRRMFRRMSILDFARRSIAAAGCCPRLVPVVRITPAAKF